MVDIYRGDIFMGDLDVYNNDKIKTAQKSYRPLIIVSNDFCNKFSPTITLVPLTSQTKQNLPTHVNIGIECGLIKESIALVECIVTLDRTILGKKVGKCTSEVMKKIDRAIQIQNGINEPFDIYKAQLLASLIKYIDKKMEYIKDKDDLGHRNSYLYELKDYCTSYGKNYKLFYNEAEKIYNNGFDYNIMQQVM